MFELNEQMLKRTGIRRRFACLNEVDQKFGSVFWFYRRFSAVFDKHVGPCQKCIHDIYLPTLGKYFAASQTAGQQMRDRDGRRRQSRRASDTASSTDIC